ncbi:hypothetical protein HY345_02040 [Candidatus Microgenomates bacterium]|nr:hypothetical protein [Candidatus Microgenomates bacterium]
MEKTGLNLREMTSSLWKNTVSKLSGVLQAIGQQKALTDPLAEHEASARRRGTPAHYDRVEAMRREERKAHHDPWA